MGSCPCPRCLMPKGLFSSLGLVKDMKSRLTNLRVYAMVKVVKARELIYQWGNTVDSAKVEDALREGSWVPILVSATDSTFMISSNHTLQNQFVEKLGPLGLDPFRMLVVDFMHECELGTWKALFTHLLRLLHALPGGAQLAATLDHRYLEFVQRVVNC
jgi:hypothetical protein